MTFLTSVIIGLCLGSSSFISMAYGKKNTDMLKNVLFSSFLINRIKSGVKQAVISIIIFCLIISSLVFVFSENLMQLFVNSSSTEIIKIGAEYLRTEGSFYIGIGILFMLYGYFRAINKPVVSVVLTVLSLGARVILAYVLSSIESIGVFGIWISIPIGWFIADFAGILIGKKKECKISFEKYYNNNLMR